MDIDQGKRKTQSGGRKDTATEHSLTGATGQGTWMESQRGEPFLLGRVSSSKSNRASYREDRDRSS